MENIFEHSDDLKSITRSTKKTNGENIEKIDEAIIWLGIIEIRAEQHGGKGSEEEEKKSGAQCSGDEVVGGGVTDVYFCVTSMTLLVGIRVPLCACAVVSPFVVFLSQRICVH